jgi:hypothetical protein
MKHPAGFELTVRGADRRDVFLDRGYELLEGETGSDEESSDYGEYTKAELQEEASSRGLDEGGNKAELIERLEEDDAQK